MFSLIDCNNFYVSCERAFKPSLENKPVVVLSNNDGCIISRSNEAKKLGIPMGAPYFKWEKFCKHHNVKIFSSNYELYGDMSQRIMTLLKSFNEEMEIYSIDEAFLLNKYILFEEMIALRNKIKSCTGIPISIGVGPTKTLAKIANYIAKNTTNSYVFYLIDALQQTSHLAAIPVEKIWGVGYRTAEKLKKINIYNAQQLRDTDSKIMRLHFNVNLEKTIQELKGIACIDLEKAQARKQIISSRSFGKSVSELHELEEVVSQYITKAATKLRKQNSVTSAVFVFLQTNIFSDKQSQYKNGVMLPTITPTDDTRDLIHIAKKCLKQIFKKGYRYHKAGIILLDISAKQIKQYDMFVEVLNPKSERVMTAIDAINQRMGKNTLFIAAEGTTRRALIKCEKRSPRYTTRWEELMTVYCR